MNESGGIKYRVAQKVVHFSTHHIFETIRDKMKRLGCNFYIAVKYSLQISSGLLYRKMATFYGFN